MEWSKPGSHRCKWCAFALVTAWPGLSSEGATAKAKTNETWRKEVQRASAIAAGAKKLKSNIAEEASARSSSGWRITKTFDVITEKEFKEEFKMTFKDAGLVPERLVDECGKDLLCVLVDGEHPRQLQIWTEQDFTNSEAIMPPGRCLRAGQAAECKKIYMTDMQQTGDAPKLLQKGLAPSKEKIKAMVEEKRAQRELKDAQAAATVVAPEAAPVKEEEAPGVVESSSESESDGGMLLPSQRKQKAEAKRKGASKGKGSNKQQKKGAGREGATRSSVSAGKGRAGLNEASLSAVSGGVGKGGKRARSPSPSGRSSVVGPRDSASQVGRPASSVGGAASGTKKQTEKLDLTQILDGASVGNSIHYAEKTLKELQESKDPEAVEQAVCLEAHINAASLAKDRPPKTSIFRQFGFVGWFGQEETKHSRPISGARPRTMMNCLILCSWHVG